MASSLLQSVVVSVALFSLLCVVGSVQASSSSSSSTSRHETNSDAFYLVESIPLGVDFTPNLTIAESWIRLLNGATKEVTSLADQHVVHHPHSNSGRGLCLFVRAFAGEHCMHVHDVVEQE